MVRRGQVRSGYEEISVPDGTTSWSYSGVSVLAVHALGAPSSATLLLTGGINGDNFIIVVNGSQTQGVTVSGSEVATPVVLTGNQAVVMYKSNNKWHALL